MDPLWVDKYRPRSLDRLDYHPQLTQVFRQLADTSDFPVFILSSSTSSCMDLRVQARRQGLMRFFPKYTASTYSSSNNKKGFSSLKELQLQLNSAYSPATIISRWLLPIMSIKTSTSFKMWSKRSLEIAILRQKVEEDSKYSLSIRPINSAKKPREAWEGLWRSIWRIVEWFCSVPTYTSW